MIQQNRHRILKFGLDGEWRSKNLDFLSDSLLYRCIGEERAQETESQEYTASHYCRPLAFRRLPARVWPVPYRNCRFIRCPLPAGSSRFPRGVRLPFVKMCPMNVAKQFGAALNLIFGIQRQASLIAASNRIVNRSTPNSLAAGRESALACRTATALLCTLSALGRSRGGFDPAIMRHITAPTAYLSVHGPSWPSPICPIAA